MKYLDGDKFATASDSEATNRSCYSFCMCPGGQVLILLKSYVFNYLIL